MELVSDETDAKTRPKRQGARFRDFVAVGRMIMVYRAFVVTP
jgi:hypothetical protein